MPRACDGLDPDHFDVVIVDEFHHAAAPSYRDAPRAPDAGRAARADRDARAYRRSDVLRWFDGRIAAELRLWDAIDQQYLVPFSYFGVHDGTDLRDVPWRRGRATTSSCADERVHGRRRVGDAASSSRCDSRSTTRARCGRSASASASRTRASWPSSSSGRGLPCGAPSGVTAHGDEREQALRDLDAGGVSVVFTVDLFNEGVDVPTSTRCCCCARPRARRCSCSSSAVGCAAHGKAAVHGARLRRHPPQEFRFDRRFRALLGAAGATSSGRSRTAFRSCRRAATWSSTASRGRSFSGASVRPSHPSGVRSARNSRAARRRLRSASTSRRLASSSRTSTPTVTAGANCVGRWLADRSAEGRRKRAAPGGRTAPACRRPRAARRISQASGRRGVRRDPSLRSADPRPAIRGNVDRVAHDADDVRAVVRWTGASCESIRRCGVSCLELLAYFPSSFRPPARAPGNSSGVPLAVHARYTRARDPRRVRRRLRREDRPLADGRPVGRSEPKRPLRLHSRQVGGWFFADDSVSRLRDQPRADPLGEPVRHPRRQPHGPALRQPAARGTNVVLFARLNTADRAFWCLGPATYVKPRRRPADRVRVAAPPPVTRRICSRISRPRPPESSENPGSAPEGGRLCLLC